MASKDWIETFFDSKRKCYRPHVLSEVLTFVTKNEAVYFCEKYGIPKNTIKRVGSRFWKAWGISDGGCHFMANNNSNVSNY